MAATIEEILVGIETRLATIDGLRVAEYSPDQVNPPQAFVSPPPIPDYHEVANMGTYIIRPTITVLVSKVMARQGQMKLASYANPTGATSIRAAVEGDRTLGGIVQDCVVDNFDPLGIREVGIIGYYGGTFGLRVIASGI